MSIRRRTRRKLTVRQQRLSNRAAEFAARASVLLSGISKNLERVWDVEELDRITAMIPEARQALASENALRDRAYGVRRTARRPKAKLSK